MSEKYCCERFEKVKRYDCVTYVGGHYIFLINKETHGCKTHSFVHIMDYCPFCGTKLSARQENKKEE